MKQLLLLPILAAAFTCSVQGAAITVAAASDNGIAAFGLTDATDDLPVGQIIRVGYFDYANDAALLLDAGSTAALNNHFFEFGFLRVGDGFGVAGHFQNLLNRPDSDLAGFANKQISLWILNSTNTTTVSNAVTTAFQQAIMYLDFTTSSAQNPDAAAWRIRGNAEVPNDVAIDLTHLTNAAGTALAPGAHLVVGTFPKGTSQATSAPNFGLLPIVPEPTAAVMMALGVAALGLRRRRY